ncbi:nitroreductase family protein [uncultured Megasphaera sp.]|uniref:nitroreductase family protein n=1 Tax=uncultured Megasphaera sp. TaxID=165188 RepID=UPI0026115EDB|nr:nitroreductase family protein [uncultured Megasphaera sp.]
MNETIQTLISRRSIRKYKAEQIPESDLQQILEAGMYAASGMGIQPVTMVVVQDKEMIAKLTAMNAKIMGTDSNPMYGAPTIVVVLADMEKSANAWSDGCLVMGNLMNAAASLGIGSCWINRAREEFESAEGKALLRQWNLPEHLVGVGHCILGYADGPVPAAKPRKADFVTYVR